MQLFFRNVSLFLVFVKGRICKSTTVQNLGQAWISPSTKPGRATWAGSTLWISGWGTTAKPQLPWTGCKVPQSHCHV